MTHLEELHSKIVSSENAVKLIAEWRKDTCKIVFTNGCFDLLHRGHIDYLAKAADLGTHLVIGLNTDNSVSRLKGAHRPITKEESRGLVMAALSFVSLVIFFDEDTPYDLIKAVQPNVLVKGGDYQLDNIVGADIVTLRGGNVTTIAFVPGYSTSGIEKKIIEAHR